MHESPSRRCHYACERGAMDVGAYRHAFPRAWERENFELCGCPVPAPKCARRVDRVGWVEAETPDSLDVTLVSFTIRLPAETQQPPHGARASCLAGGCCVSAVRRILQTRAASRWRLGSPASTQPTRLRDQPPSACESWLKATAQVGKYGLLCVVCEYHGSVGTKPAPVALPINGRSRNTGHKVHTHQANSSARIQGEDEQRISDIEQGI